MAVRWRLSASVFQARIISICAFGVTGSELRGRRRRFSREQRCVDPLFATLPGPVTKHRMFAGQGHHQGIMNHQGSVLVSNEVCRCSETGWVDAYLTADDRIYIYTSLPPSLWVTSLPLPVNPTFLGHLR